MVRSKTPTKGMEKNGGSKKPNAPASGGAPYIIYESETPEARGSIKVKKR